MFENFSFEALAHYTRGMATIFFVICTLITYGWRKRNRMTFLLFVTVCYVTLGYIKDTIFVFPLFNENRFVENLSSLFDLACTPFVCAFFLDTTCPGKLSKRDIVLSYLLFAAFMPLYCIFPSEKVMFGAYILAALVAIYTLVIVPFNVIRYNKFLADNVSYTKNISVNWAIICVFIYFLWLSIYAFCFWDPTWLGEVVFDVFSIVAWSTICLLSRHHKVVADMLHGEDALVMGHTEDRPDRNREGKAEYAKEQSAEEYRRRREDFIANALVRCMEKDKLYLNPLLSLNDLAMAVGCNKTYISTFINSQGKTFYDYVNEYRVSEACRMMDTSDERLSMADVATRSGFNSMSTFNRYFLKIKGVTPTNYYRYRT